MRIDPVRIAQRGNAMSVGPQQRSGHPHQAPETGEHCGVVREPISKPATRGGMPGDQLRRRGASLARHLAERDELSRAQARGVLVEHEAAAHGRQRRLDDPAE